MRSGVCPGTPQSPPDRLYLQALGQLLGALAILGAAASGVISSFVVNLQYRDKGVPPTTTTLFSLSGGAVLVAPVAAVTASGDIPGAGCDIGDRARLGLHRDDVSALLPAHRRDVGGAGGDRQLSDTHLRVVLRCDPARRAAHDLGCGRVALIIVGAEITFRGDSAKRGGRKVKAHEYQLHPPFHYGPRPSGSPRRDRSTPCVQARL